MSIPKPDALVGDLAFHTWNGWTPSEQNDVDVFLRPGDTTDGYQVTATHGHDKQVKTMTAFTSQQDALSFAANAEALQGTSAQLIDQWNRTQTVLFSMVTALPKGCAGEAPYRVECEITLRVIAPGI